MSPLCRACRIFACSGRHGTKSTSLAYAGGSAETTGARPRRTGHRAASAEDGAPLVPGRRYAERGNNVVDWTEFDRGHFAAMEAPDLLVGDVRAFFRRYW